MLFVNVTVPDVLHDGGFIVRRGDESVVRAFLGFHKGRLPVTGSKVFKNVAKESKGIVVVKRVGYLKPIVDDDVIVDIAMNVGNVSAVYFNGVDGDFP